MADMFDRFVYGKPLRQVQAECISSQLPRGEYERAKQLESKLNDLDSFDRSFSYAIFPNASEIGILLFLASPILVPILLLGIVKALIVVGAL